MLAPSGSITGAGMPAILPTADQPLRRPSTDSAMRVAYAGRRRPPATRMRVWPAVITPAATCAT